MTKLDLLKEINSMYDHISQISINADSESLLEELGTCNAYLGRSAQLQADAEEFLNIAKGEASEKYFNSLKAMDERFNATQSKLFVESRTIPEIKIYTLAERLNRTITHRIESIRSILSLEKQLRASAGSAR